MKAEMIPMTQPPQLPWRDRIVIYRLSVGTNAQQPECVAVHICCSESHEHHNYMAMQLLCFQSLNRVATQFYQKQHFYIFFSQSWGSSPGTYYMLGKHVCHQALSSTLYVSHVYILRNISR